MQFIEYFQNISLARYLYALVVVLGVLVASKIFQFLVLRHFKRLAERTKTDIDDLFIEILKKVRPPFYFFLAVYFGLKVLEIVAWLDKILTSILIAWVIYLAILAFQSVIDYIIKKKAKEDKTTESAFQLLGKILKGVLWGIGLLFILSNLGVNITSLVAGLGIGGIAVAFALQNILEDLFSSFAIYFDKPFRVGDYIIVGQHKGAVEKIGIKTTRLRSVHGEEVVISNRALTNAEIQNFGRVKERRALFKIGVIYETPQEKLEKIPEIIQKIIEEKEMTRFDRVHFVEYGDFSLNFEISFYVETSDYKTFLDIQQKILFKIREEFQKQGIEFAYPTQTVYLKKL
ncbi:MAG: mechanosensitive ion channel family protein [Candidatus Pacebacteria bacterium]|nr:mechanosensitive ion channel family protein [Candidatus Paceibacterota bacterium]